MRSTSPSSSFISLKRRAARAALASGDLVLVAYGSLLGVFLLGVLTRRATETGAMVGMLCGFVLNVSLWQGTHVPFPWYVPLGSAVTFAVGYAASMFSPATSHLEREQVDIEKSR